jgi:hypothetical protein
MQVIVDRVNGMIRAALRNYLAAERDLNVANEAGAAELAARQAVDLLHHFADFVSKEPDPALPAFKKRGRPQRYPAALRIRTLRATNRRC